MLMCQDSCVFFMKEISNTCVVQDILIIEMSDNNICKNRLAVFFNRLKNNKKIKKILINIADVKIIDFEIIRFVKKLQADFKNIPISFYNVDITNNMILNMYGVDKKNQIFMTQADAFSNTNPLVKRRFKVVNF